MQERRGMKANDVKQRPDTKNEREQMKERSEDEEKMEASRQKSGIRV